MPNPDGQQQQRSNIMRIIGQKSDEPGRGTKYDPEFCWRVRDMAQEGKLPEEWCAEIGITMATAYNWCRWHEEFDEAWRIAWIIVGAYWSRQIRKAAVDPMNPTRAALLEIARKRFPSTWGKAPTNTAEAFDLIRAAEAGQAAGITDVGGTLMTAEERDRRIVELEQRRAAARAERGTDG
jgi:hypothetical protein